MIVMMEHAHASADAGASSNEIDEFPWLHWRNSSDVCRTDQHTDQQQRKGKETERKGKEKAS